MAAINYNFDFDKHLMSELSKVNKVLEHKLDYMDILSVSIVFPILRRVDCYIKDYTQEMADCYIQVKNKSEEIFNSEMSKASHHSSFYNYSGINFATLLAHPDKLDYYLNSYANCFNHGVKYILSMLDFATLVAKMKHAQCLYEVVNLYASMDLGPSITSIDICKVFQNLVLNKEQNSTSSLFSKYVAAMIFGKDIDADIIKLYDPVCGKGSLINLITFGAYLRYRGKEVDVYGQDIDKYSASIMAACNFLIGEDSENIKIGNTITTDLFPNDTFQYIVADLPSHTFWKRFEKEIYMDSGETGRFWMGIPKADSQLLFIQHIISKMNPVGSRAVVITNSQPLWGGDHNDSEIRRTILDKDLVELIIALPNSKNSSKEQRYLWVLSNVKPPHRQGRVHLIDANYMKEVEKEQIDGDDSLLACINQFYDIDFPTAYHCYKANEDFGQYQISIRDSQRKRTFTVEVPIKENPNAYLEKRNLLPSQNENLEILYDKTIAVYKVDFNEYFSREEELLPSEEIYQDVQSTITAMSEFSKELQSMPKLTLSTELTTVNAGVFNEVPTHWKGMFLSDLLTFKSGKKYQKESFSEASLPVLSIAELRNQTYSYTSFTTDEKAVFVHEEDVVIISNGANSGEIFFGQEGTALGNGLILARRNSDVLAEHYLFYLLSALKLKRYAKGEGVKHLPISILENIYVYLPPVHEQELMVEYMRKLNASVMRVCGMTGVDIPSIVNYQESLFSEIIRGKCAF